MKEKLNVMKNYSVGANIHCVQDKMSIRGISETIRETKMVKLEKSCPFKIEKHALLKTEKFISEYM